MSDSDAVDSIMQELQRRQEEEQGRARKELAATCDRLTHLGVTRVDITYDGCGDSGTVESVNAFAGDSDAPLPEDLVEALEEAACGLLPGGWELNEGSFGQLVLDVAARTIKGDRFRVRGDHADGDGSESDMPPQNWKQLVTAAEEALDRPEHFECLLWVSNLGD